jgi:AcrR family transcriptional regulator
MVRLNRAQQGDRNRELVLAAAGRVFRERGYERATLDVIAEEAGFSKGVVYSRFGSKADLFLRLLERRVTERAAEHERVATSLAGAEAVVALTTLSSRLQAADPAWALAVVEFRTHAAREPELNARYGELHERNVALIQGLLDGIFERSGTAPRFPLRHMAEHLLALGTGMTLERAVDTGAMPADTFALMLAGAFGLVADVSAPTVA